MRFATFAQAIANTAPIVPISTQSVLAMLPTIVSLSDTNAGATRQFATASRWAPPGAAGQASSQIGSMRAASACASASVTPGLSRPMPCKLPKPARTTRLRSSLDRQYHLGLGRHVEEAESGGHYADDFRGTRIDRHAAADDARIAAEFPLPIRVGQDHGSAGLENGAGRLRRMVGLGEPPAEHRLNTERLEHAARHDANPRLLGSPIPVTVCSAVCEDVRGARRSGSRRDR